jgi:hypothetical protein
MRCFWRTQQTMWTSNDSHYAAYQFLHLTLGWSSILSQISIGSLSASPCSVRISELIQMSLPQVAMKCSAHQEPVLNAFVTIISVFQAIWVIIWNSTCHCQILKLKLVWLRWGVFSKYTVHYSKLNWNYFICWQKFSLGVA